MPSMREGRFEKRALYEPAKSRAKFICNHLAGCATLTVPSTGELLKIQTPSPKMEKVFILFCR